MDAIKANVVNATFANDFGPKNLGVYFPKTPMYISILICFSIKLMNLIALQKIHQKKDSIQSQEMVTTELRLVRTILERLECAFAIQEAKLDRLLTLMQTAPTVQQQPLQFQPSIQPTQFSTPIQSTISQSNSSVEYVPSTALPRAQETGSSALQEMQRLLDDTNTTGNQQFAWKK